MDKITEEALTSMAIKISALEEEVRILKKKTISQPQSPQVRLATASQIWRIKEEGGRPWPNMTLDEASALIDKLTRQTAEDKEIEKEAMRAQEQEPIEVDTDDAGVDEEGLI